ncbi:hypothetical protein KZC51_17375 [Microbacterium sp. SSW1-49]|uniref:Histidine kinase/HSP90-like ATPase domain-containing protein n=1 Tax=Microbacterium croceum TaxID=2851645 RepID=A0ABT0FIL7_9MICO|nr:hypothetical protein [Microbacterium croceum]MCK2037903.1 hypothetical protein [Microbacterium croceum]
MSAAGLAVLLAWLLIDVIAGPSPYASWWLWGHALLAVLLVVAAVSPARVLRAPVLKALWVIIPIMGILLQLTAFIAEATPEGAALPGEATIWQVTWMLTAVYVSLLALLLARTGEPTKAQLLVRLNVAAAVLAVAPALSVWVQYRDLAPLLISITVIQFGNVSFAILLVLFRARMIPYFVVQERWQRRAAAVAAAEARLAEERELARVAHDNVLGVLNSAAMWSSAETVKLPALVVNMAADALRALDLRVASRAASHPLGVARQVLVRTAARLGVDNVELGSDEGDASLPSEIVQAVADAMSEAIRNSARHASATNVRVYGVMHRGEIDLTVADDGPGFDLAAVPSDRFGIRESIFGRLERIPGASAGIDSSPGSGTRVHLAWLRPTEDAEVAS